MTRVSSQRDQPGSLFNRQTSPKEGHPQALPGNKIITVPIANFSLLDRYLIRRKVVLDGIGGFPGLGRSVRSTQRPFVKVIALEENLIFIPTA